MRAAWLRPGDVAPHTPPTTVTTLEERAAIRAAKPRVSKGCRSCNQPPAEATSDFDRVVVINLARRADRLKAFTDGLPADWPFPKPERFDAVDVARVPVPTSWVSQPGAYGCKMSHLEVIGRALQDGVKSLLVLEDDATFDAGFAARVKAFLAAVPNDWEVLMLGGQHMGKASSVAPGIVRCLNTQRTHAYAARGNGLRTLYSTWAEADRHIDHLSGPKLATLKAYAPDPFLVGQRADRSDITNAKTPTKFWGKRTGRETVYLLRGSKSWVDGLRDRGEYHTGFNRERLTGYDYGLDRVTAEGGKGLRAWLDMLLGECERTRLGVWHPGVTAEMIRAAWKGPVVVVEEQTDLPVVKQPRVVWHVASMNHWREVVSKQLRLMKQVGLIHVTGTFVGDGHEWLETEASRLGVDLNIVRSDPNLMHYETFSMLEIERLAKESNDPILYFHTKGVSDNKKSKEMWRLAMEKLVVEKWRDNLQLLRDHDAVGFNWNPGNDPHFSGNFWLSSATWLRSLPDFADYHAAKGMTRMSCEFWIGSRPGARAKSLGPIGKAWWDVDYASWVGKT